MLCVKNSLAVKLLEKGAFPLQNDHLDNGKTCDLKKDATARSMLQMMDTAPKKGFDLTVTDPADVTGFLRYMLEAGRMDRVAG